MNAVGEVGRFIFENQELIWAGLIIFAIILVVVIVGKIIVSQRKKSELLQRIDRTVSEIHSTVGELQMEGKKDSSGNGIIYIDNRNLKQEPAEEKEETVTADENAAEPEYEITKAEDEAESQKPESHLEEAETEEETQQQSIKFESLDSAVSRNGRSYTIEELEAQIK